MDRTSPEPASDGANPIHVLLDSIGLPWREPRAALTERHGVTPHPAYGWAEVQIPTPRPLVEGLLWPLSIQALPQFPPDLPATGFSGVTWFREDARENVRRTAEQLEPALGRAPIADHHNTVRCQWSFGAASISLMAWPPDRQSHSGSNPSQEREPRLVTGCHVAIETGWRKRATARERSWLETFAPIAPLPLDEGVTAASALTTPAWGSQLAFVREPVPGLERIFGFVGVSADGAAFIFQHAQLFLVPMDDLVGFHVVRVLPAKGGGGSWIEVQCRGLEGRLPLCRAAGPDDLTGLAQRIAAATGKPLDLGGYQYDV